jgi:hypothetical protein
MGFSRVIDCTFAKSRYSDVDVAVAGHNERWNADAASYEVLMEFDAAGAWHAHIQYQAAKH